MIARKEQEKDKAEPSQSLIYDIGTTLRYVDEDFGSRMQHLTSLLQSLEITWDLLFALFPPREVLFAQQHGLLAQEQASYLVDSNYRVRPNNTQYFEVIARIINHDGENFGWADLIIEIDEYDGTKMITSLPIFSFRYFSEHEEKKRDLIERGRKYISIIRRPTCQEYLNSMGVKLDRPTVMQLEFRLPDKHMKVAVRLIVFFLSP